MWEHAFEQRLRSVASERPVLCAEASWSTAKERRGLMELMFEKFGVPAMFPAKNAMLSAFSAGRANALVRLTATSDGSARGGEGGIFGKKMHAIKIFVAVLTSAYQ